MRIPKIRVFNRSKHSWCIEFYWKGQKFPWTAGPTEQDAQTLKAKTMLCFTEGRFEGRRSDVEPDPSQAAIIATKRLTVAKLIDEFLVTKARKKSYSFYEHTTNVLSKSLGTKYVDTLTERDVKVFMDARSAEVAKPTRNRSLVVLKMMLEHARALGYIKTNPADGFKLERETKRREFFLEPEQFGKLLEHSPEWLRPLLVMAAYTGGRQSELLGLTWEDVDLDAKRITFRGTKNGEDRSVPVSRRLLTILKKEMPSRFLGGYVFRDPELTDEKKVPIQLTRGRVRRPFEEAVTAAKLVQIVKTEDGKRVEDELHFHDLRHTYASWQVQAGTPLNTVRTLLGHKSLEMTLRYAHLAPEHLKVAADALDRLDIESTTNPPHEANASADAPSAS
jgi:integrase